MSGKNSSRVRVIGITGGIASGKNFVSEIFSLKGIPVFDADKEVHQAYEGNNAIISQIKQFFPKSFIDGKIDRKVLQRAVFKDNSEVNLKILEKILHPMVQKNYQKFLVKAQKNGDKIIVLNIPLLHESNFYQCDKILAVIASPSIQKKRFLARERKKNPCSFNKLESEKKLSDILKKQLGNKDHKLKADFIIDANKSKSETAKQAKAILNIIRQLPD